MKRFIRMMLLAAVAAAGLLFVGPSSAKADDYDRYWGDYWGWYDNDYRPFYRQHNRYWRDNYYRDRDDWRDRRYGRDRDDWRDRDRYGRGGVRVGPFGVYWR